MKGLQAGIPIAILAAVSRAHAQGAHLHDEGGNNVAIPIANYYENPGSSHHSPALYDRPHGGPPGQGPGHGAGPHGGERHPPMVHTPATTRRALKNGGEEPSDDDDSEEDSPPKGGHSGIPTCATHTEHVVRTVTQTVLPVTGSSLFPVSADPQHSSAAHVAMQQHSSSKTNAHVAQSSSVVNAPMQQHATSSVVNAPFAQSSAAHVAQQAASSSGKAPQAPVIASPTPTPTPSSPLFGGVPGSHHGSQSTSVAGSSPVVHGAAFTSTYSVHGAASYSVIPVNVPSSSHSIKLHGSNSAATPSSSGPVGVDAHGTMAAHPSSSSGVSFTGAAAQLAPSAGVVSAVCGLFGLLAYAL